VEVGDGREPSSIFPFLLVLIVCYWPILSVLVVACRDCPKNTT